MKAKAHVRAGSAATGTVMVMVDGVGVDLPLGVVEAPGAFGTDRDDEPAPQPVSNAADMTTTTHTPTSRARCPLIDLRVGTLSTAHDQNGKLGPSKTTRGRVATAARCGSSTFLAGSGPGGRVVGLEPAGGVRAATA